MASAAAVAAGLVPIASAGDGGGSIRLPAASCGLFGLKPSRGRISLAPLEDGWNGLAVLGCLSRNVLDTALWLDITAGGSSEPGAPPPPDRPFVESAKTPPGKLRVAYSTLAPRAAAPPIVSDDVKQAVFDAAELMRSLGHEVAQRDPDWGGIGNNITPRFLRGVADDRRRSAASRAPGTAHPRLRPARAARSRTRSTSGLCAAARPTSPGSTRSSTPSTC